MQYEYINSVMPLGATDERIEARVKEYEANGYDLDGMYALDTGNLVLRFKRPKYRPGVTS